MPDTQWPRYEVFKQDKPNKPHEAIGTVHAPDAELALQNARDVHVRRPDCHSLWVAPEDAILKMTAQQLQHESDFDHTAHITVGSLETYQLFNKQTQRRSMIAAFHVGEITALSAIQALHQAITSGNFATDPVYVWWIVPDRTITRSSVDDILSMFEPAKDKGYRHQSRYAGTVGNRADVGQTQRPERG